jgi:hypothetical protein
LLGGVDPGLHVLGVRPGVPGREVDQGGLAAGGEQQGRPSGEGTDVLVAQDALPPEGDRFAGAAVAVAEGPYRDVVVADQPGEVLGEAGVVQAGADQFDGGGGPVGARNSSQGCDQGVCAAHRVA